MERERYEMRGDHNVDKWDDEWVDERIRHRRRREGDRERWCCPDWEMGEHGSFNFNILINLLFTV